MRNEEVTVRGAASEPLLFGGTFQTRAGSFSDFSE